MFCSQGAERKPSEGRLMFEKLGGSAWLIPAGAIVCRAVRSVGVFSVAVVDVGAELVNSRGWILAMRAALFPVTERPRREQYLCNCGSLELSDSKLTGQDGRP